MQSANPMDLVGCDQPTISFMFFRWADQPKKWIQQGAAEDLSPTTNSHVGTEGSQEAATSIHHE